MTEPRTVYRVSGPIADCPEDRDTAVRFPLQAGRRLPKRSSRRTRNPGALSDNQTMEYREERWGNPLNTNEILMMTKPRPGLTPDAGLFVW